MVLTPLNKLSLKVTMLLLFSATLPETFSSIIYVTLNHYELKNVPKGNLGTYDF
jgi:hypothetical protein